MKVNEEAAIQAFDEARGTSRAIFTLINDHDPSTLHCWPPSTRLSTIKRSVTKIFNIFFNISPFETATMTINEQQSEKQRNKRKSIQGRIENKIKIPTETFQFLTWKLMVWTLFFPVSDFDYFSTIFGCLLDIFGRWISTICKLINFIELLSVQYSKELASKD